MLSSGGVTVDPSNPAAGISDPVANLPVIASDCTTGQTNVNSASASTLITKMGVSKNTALQLIAGRPWQRSIDTISVPGIGPAKANLLTTKFCAPPPVLPQRTPLACDPAGAAVDLQSASREAIGTTTGLNPNVVGRLIAARPLPQDLHQVAAPRVPGFSNPTVTRLVSQGIVCVTPAPFNFDGQGWRWISPDGGSVITAPNDLKYALFAPPGITTDHGAWGRVTPLPNDEFGSPHGDFHIYQAWTGQVGVRLPSDNTVANTSQKTMITHHNADGTESLSWGSTVAEGPGYSTIATDRLSDLTSDPFECLPKAGAIGAIADCSDSPFDIQPYDLGRQRGQQLVTDVQHALTLRTVCSSSGMVHATGTIPFGMSCGNDGGAGGTATWSLHNNTGASILSGLAVSTGVFFQVTPSTDATQYDTSYVNLGEEGVAGGLISAARHHLAESSSPILAPNAGLDLTKRQGTPITTLNITPLAAPEAASLWVLWNALSLADDAYSLSVATWGRDRLPSEVGNMYSSVGLCIAGLGLSGIDGVAGCVSSATQAGIGKIYDLFPDKRVYAARTMKTAMRTTSFILKYIPLITDGLSSSIFSIAALNGAGDSNYWYTAPPAPSGVGGNNTGSNPDGGADGTILNDTSEVGDVLVRIGGDGNENRNFAYFVAQGDRVAHGVVGTEALYCAAHLYPLRDWLPISNVGSYWFQESIYLKDCDQADPPSALKFVQGNETNFILRQFPKNGQAGKSWYVDGESALHPITDGGTYVCLAQKFYVLDGRTDTEIAKFGQETTSAGCTG